MKRLNIDIETYSNINLKRCGVYKYSASKEFNILLFGFKEDDKPVQVIDLTREKLPDYLLQALEDPTVTKHAFNAQFERVCLDRFYNISSCNWECTMIKAWNAGITGSLDAVSRAIGIPEDKQKIRDGKRLINYFSKPQKKTWSRPTTAPYTRKERPDDWAKFMKYCGRDVEVEYYIDKKLDFIKQPEKEKDLYRLDQKINGRGIRIDLDMARNAIKIINDQDAKYNNLFYSITGIEKPTQIIPFKEWINNRLGTEIKSISKNNKDKLFKLCGDDEEAKLALECRYSTGRTSTAKYNTMLEATETDGRMRGTLQFYGAQTGRWAGRLLQVQNLPKNHVKDLKTAREIVKNTDFEFMEMMYEDPADILTQCIRPCIIPSDGNKFIVSDYSAIEARVIAYLAHEDWVLDVFRTTGKIYEATAAQMLNIPMESIKKPSPERQKGKVATLALGYQGGVGSLKAMGALKMGIPEEELPGIVQSWRATHPKTKSFWYETQHAVEEVISTKNRVPLRSGMEVFYDKGIVFIKLLSGRLLSYPKMYMKESSKFPGSMELFYGVVNANGSWRAQSTYGGRLVENIVQATARDCLAHAMLRLDEEGYKTVMHVHDEVLIEVRKDDDKALKRIQDIMSEEIPWAPGLPLDADAYECDYYQKD